MTVLPILAIVFAGLEAWALAKKNLKLEFIAKPAVMICLSAWLFLATGWRGAALWFGIGALLSLVGDVFLLWLDRFFVFGLVAFLLAHLAYLVGFNTPLPQFSLWSLLLALIVGLGAVRVIRRLLTGVHASGESRMAIPVAIYGVVITLMLLSALLTLSDTNWNALASVAVALGAFLFYLSDIVLAWNKFLAPIKNGRVLNIGLYHAGQFLLIAGVVMQFSK
jgi:uncharacterized membrane protein YhhN